MGTGKRPRFASKLPVSCRSSAVSHDEGAGVFAGAGVEAPGVLPCAGLVAEAACCFLRAASSAAFLRAASSAAFLRAASRARLRACSIS